MPMSFDRAFSTDRDLEENGKWFKDILNDGSNIDLRIRRMSSDLVTTKTQEIISKNKYKMVKGVFKKEDDDALFEEICGEAVVVDWRGVTDETGEAIPFSSEKCQEYMSNYRDFRAIVTRLSNSMDAFRREVENEIAKN